MRTCESQGIALYGSFSNGKFPYPFVSCLFVDQKKDQISLVFPLVDNEDYFGPLAFGCIWVHFGSISTFTRLEVYGIMRPIRALRILCGFWPPELHFEFSLDAAVS